jgi:hypothetical protein
MAPKIPQASPLTVASTNTALRITAAEGVTLEAIDLSYAAGNRMGLDEYTPIGAVGKDGNAELPLALALPVAKAGDYVRVRAKNKDGVVVGTVTVRLSGTDTTHAPLAPARLALYDDGSGKAALLWAQDVLRPASEPFAKFRLSNVRTGAETTVTLDENGALPADFSLAGKVGDEYTLAVSDGTTNVDFKNKHGKTLVVAGKTPREGDIADPSAYSEHLDPKGRTIVGLRHYTGPLFVDGASPNDVEQRYIGDCYLPAALSSIAKFDPKRLETMIVQSADKKSYTVTFKDFSVFTDKYEDKKIVVDADFYVDSEGGLVYGASIPSGDAKTMELWWPLIEKAYAQWKGSYDKIGHGGSPHDVMEAILGRKGSSTIPADADALWAAAKKAVDAKLPSSLATSKNEERYKSTGIHGNHCYSILGYEVDKVTKQRYLILRNPWGNDEPGSDGKDDGVFKFKIEDAKKLFDEFYTVE